MKDEILMPTRTVRDYLSSALVWNDFLAQGGFVPGDIVVADPFKAGTTWTQRILQQILDNGEERGASLADTSPWLDSSWGDHPVMLAMLKEQRENGQRRVIKSHLPADALPIAPQARYVFVGRNGKDLGISLHNYLSQFSAGTMAAIDRVHAQWSDDPSPLVIPASMREFFDRWLATDGYGCCDLFDVMRSWWQLRGEPNVLLVHYRQLKEDLPGQVARIAGFIGAAPAQLCMDRILEPAPSGTCATAPSRWHRSAARTWRTRRSSSTRGRPATSGPSSLPSRSSASIGWPRRSSGASVRAGWRPAKSPPKRRAARSRDRAHRGRRSRGAI